MKAKDVTIGMRVRFHPIIGGKHDQNVYTVVAVGKVCDQQVAWVTGKAGCVAVAALSQYEPGADNYGKLRNGQPERESGI